MLHPSPFSLGRHSWWWVFGLFIATPALALAVLGFRALRVDEIERQQRLRDQQAQIAHLADAAIATVLDQVVATARTPRGPADSNASPGDGPPASLPLFTGPRARILDSRRTSPAEGRLT